MIALAIVLAVGGALLVLLMIGFSVTNDSTWGGLVAMLGVGCFLAGLEFVLIDCKSPWWVLPVMIACAVGPVAMLSLGEWLGRRVK